MFSKLLKIFIIYVFIIITFSLPTFSQSNTPFLRIISPNGGENWVANSTQTITWQSSNVSKIKIEFSLSGGLDWVIINNSVDASLGEYSWKVADAQTPYVLIRISSTSNSVVYDISDREFSIYIKPPIKKSFTIKKN